MVKMSENETPSLLFLEGAAPSTPAAAQVKLYAKADGLLYSKDDAGVETALGVSGGGAGDMLAANDLSDVASVPTARTNLGVGTGDSPQFAGLNVGHASDTTVTRDAAGDIAVEGNRVYRAGGTDVPVTDGGTGASSASGARTNLGLGTGALLVTDTDVTLAANSDTNVATQKAVKAYVDAAVIGLLDFKGGTDCSANPNYPAALKGDAYVVTVAGKIGGASGTTVEVGDWYIASADNAGGTEASVGTSWAKVERNLVGALISGGALGTPSSGNLGNCTALPLSTGVTGTLQAAQVPAFAGGDVTSAGASLALTIAAGAVTLAKQASVATLSFLGRLTASTGVQEVLTALQAWGILMGQTAALTAPALSGLSFSFPCTQSTTSTLRYGQGAAAANELIVPLGYKLLIYNMSGGISSGTIAAGQTSTWKLYVDTVDQSSNFAAFQLTDSISEKSAETSTPGTPYVVDATGALKVVEIKVTNTATGGTALPCAATLWCALIRP